jgi:ABC-type enterochelin transport system permease subunit
VVVVADSPLLPPSFLGPLHRLFTVTILLVPMRWWSPLSLPCHITLVLIMILTLLTLAIAIAAVAFVTVGPCLAPSLMSVDLIYWYLLQYV